MQIPVLVEPAAGGGYVARAGSPFDWTAAGATPDEAVTNLRAAALKCVAGGCVVASVDAPVSPPVLRWAGTLDPNDPAVQEWKRAIEEYRLEVDNDPNRL